MQNRYFGDIGDFAKFGLLRGLVMPEPGFRLGVLWYLVPGEFHTNDGRYVGYLQPTPTNIRHFRTCDPLLYDQLADFVRAGRREVLALQESGLLPSQTTYHDEPLSYQRVVLNRVVLNDRRDFRERWLHSAYESAAGADVVFLDPDNGLETGTDRYHLPGPKYAFYDDVVPLGREGKTLVIYQHANRDASFGEQIQARLAALRERLGGPPEAFMAMRWRTISARAFLIAASGSHVVTITKHLQQLLAGPWARHFERLRLDS